MERGCGLSLALPSVGQRNPLLRSLRHWLLMNIALMHGLILHIRNKGGLCPENRPIETNKAFDSIESAVDDIRMGRMVIVVDDEHPENEGDLVAAAECATPEMINFMASKGRGLICTPLLESRCRVDLSPMVEQKYEFHQTAFTVSVDLIGQGVTTGISASDRAKTIKSLVDNSTRPEDLARPGIYFRFRQRGRRAQAVWTCKASIDLARLAGLKPAGVIVEIMNEGMGPWRVFQNSGFLHRNLD